MSEFADKESLSLLIQAANRPHHPALPPYTSYCKLVLTSKFPNSCCDNHFWDNYSLKFYVFFIILIILLVTKALTVSIIWFYMLSDRTQQNESA